MQQKECLTDDFGKSKPSNAFIMWWELKEGMIFSNER